MITYYIEDEGKIVLFDSNKDRILSTLKLLPKYAGLELKETERPIEDYQFADTDSYIASKTKKEIENRLIELEAQTGLIRPMREMILAENSGTSEYAKAKARELEELAEQLRG